jgi:hypothetical protein
VLIPTPHTISHVSHSDVTIPPPFTASSAVNSHVSVTPPLTSNQEISNLNAEIDNLKQQNQELELHLANSWDVKSSLDEEDKSDVSSNHSDVTPHGERLQLSEIQDTD